jgi:phosphate transport system protein
MGTTCVELGRGAVGAWIDRDVDAAAALDAADDQLDDLQDQLMIELEKADIALVDALQTTLVARFYERLGDHAVHITERVRYLVAGS